MAERTLNEQVARRFIMVAWIAATLSAVVHFIGALVLSVFNLFDVALFAGLGFGVYRRSRTCAIILLVYHLGSRLYFYRTSGDPAIVFGLIPMAWTGAYILGVLGTFAIHANQADKKAGPGFGRASF